MPDKKKLEAKLQVLRASAQSTGNLLLKVTQQKQNLEARLNDVRSRIAYTEELISEDEAAEQKEAEALKALAGEGLAEEIEEKANVPADTGVPEEEKGEALPEGDGKN